MSDMIGADDRKVSIGTHAGQAARFVTLTRTYPVPQNDLWDAVTNPDRIPRWFDDVSGDLSLNERYRIEGNASGTITRCDAPEVYELTWEIFGSTSWVRVAVMPDGDDARMTLDHIQPIDGPGEEHWQTYGPAAVGVGWEMALLGLGLYLDAGHAAYERPDPLEWGAQEANKAFMRDAAAGWAKAHIAAGEDHGTAERMAQATGDFYTGG